MLGLETTILIELFLLGMFFGVIASYHGKFKMFILILALVLAMFFFWNYGSPFYNLSTSIFTIAILIAGIFIGKYAYERMFKGGWRHHEHHHKYDKHFLKRHPILIICILIILGYLFYVEVVPQLGINITLPKGNSSFLEVKNYNEECRKALPELVYAPPVVLIGEVNERVLSLGVGDTEFRKDPNPLNEGYEMTGFPGKLRPIHCSKKEEVGHNINYFYCETFEMEKTTKNISPEGIVSSITKIRHEVTMALKAREDNMCEIVEFNCKKV